MATPGRIPERIYVAGHQGMVGSAIVRLLEQRGIAPIVSPRAQLNLLDQAAVRSFFQREKPDAVILAAAKVGGIQANASLPAEFIYENLMIECNVIGQAFRAGVERLLFLGSSCIYPRDAAQPMRENALLTGPLEETNEPYALAKIAGIKLCESFNRQYGTDYRSVMPTNLYGPGIISTPRTRMSCQLCCGASTRPVLEERMKLLSGERGVHGGSSFLSMIWPMHRFS